MKKKLRKGLRLINSEGYTYLVDTKQEVGPNDLGYLDSTYNDGRKGLIVAVTSIKTYPDSYKEGDFDSCENVYNVDVVNKSEVAPNVHDGKVHFPKSYHLSHLNSRYCGKVISSNNPNLKLPMIDKKLLS